MSSIQKFFAAIFPARWAKSMEAHSRSWMMRCECGYEKSIWDMGGIRWKARGNPRSYRKCQECGNRSWHTIYQKFPVV